MIKPLKVGQFNFQQPGQTISEKITVLWASIIYEAIPKILISFSWEKNGLWNILCTNKQRMCVCIKIFFIRGHSQTTFTYKGMSEKLINEGERYISWLSKFVEISEKFPRLIRGDINIRIDRAKQLLRPRAIWLTRGQNVWISSKSFPPRIRKLFNRRRSCKYYFLYSSLYQFLL